MGTVLKRSIPRISFVKGGRRVEFFLALHDLESIVDVWNRRLV